MSSMCSGVSTSTCINTVGAASTFASSNLLFSGLMYAFAFLFVMFVAWKQYSGLGPGKVTFYSLFSCVIQAIAMAFFAVMAVHSVLR